jgi:hypothetical protein
VILLGPIAMLAGWLSILAFGNAVAVAVAVCGPVLLALTFGELMPRAGRPVQPSEPTAVDIEAEHIRSFAESLDMPPQDERGSRDSQR